MPKNIASLSLMILVGALAHAYATPHAHAVQTHASAVTAMEPVHFFEEKFVVPAAAARVD